MLYLWNGSEIAQGQKIYIVSRLKALQSSGSRSCRFCFIDSRAVPVIAGLVLLMSVKNTDVELVKKYI